VFPGGRLTLDAVVRQAGRTAIYIAAEAHNEDGKLVATAMSTVQVLRMPSPQ
jgi:acyl-coenzyme A thioesterase PaaI-like protein